VERRGEEFGVSLVRRRENSLAPSLLNTSLPFLRDLTRGEGKKCCALAWIGVRLRGSYAPLFIDFWGETSLLLAWERVEGKWGRN